MILCKLGTSRSWRYRDNTCYYAEETYLQSLREDSAYGLWLASLAQSWSVPPLGVPDQRDFSLLTATGDVGGPPHYLQRRTTGRWSCRSCLWVSLLLGWLYRSCCFSGRAYQSLPHGRWAVSLDLRAGASKVSEFHFLDHWSVFALHFFAQHY